MTPGMTLAKLAKRLGSTESDAAELIRPFLEAGIIDLRNGRLIVDVAVAHALGSPEPPDGAASERRQAEERVGRR